MQPKIPTSEQRVPHPAQQATVAIGQPAIARGDPDCFALAGGQLPRARRRRVQLSA
ncbi:hypothetical protein ACU4GD_45945 [Cupriavidus basilensis]